MTHDPDLTLPAVSRRTVLGWAGLSAATAAGGLVLGACTAPSPTSAGSTAASPDRSTKPSSSSSRPTGTMLLAFFSRSGENYDNGGRRNLRTGNTKVLARMLVDQLSCDVYEIEARDPYSNNYDDTVARNVQEQRNDSRPAIAGPIPSLTGYDTILLGSPIWNVRPPMIMTTFVETADWTGKTLYPFVTYAISGLGSTERDYRQAARGARLGEGLAVRGEEVEDAAARAATWLRSIGLS